MASAARIHPDTHIGAVALVVADLARSLDYYQNGIGLRLLARENGIAHLGVGERELLRLYEQPGAKPFPQRGRSGLYHFAILTPSREALGVTLQHLIHSQTPIGGASDHGVSEALYLTDPDGHGIEIYRDRPRSEWPMDGDELRMTLDPLDAPGILAAGAGRPWTGLAEGTTIGHIHLHVSQIGAAESFYVETLGFDLMQRYGGQASFISAGGYHHHIGINTWAGVGVPPPSPEMARLLWYEIRVPDEGALEEALARVRAAQLPIERHEQGWLVRDPAQNPVVLRT
ncbi:MAG TPA: VOC family protein [Caldilineaceae bacterium]|nr:VOC family protein [Caldilineaceae bacterium]